MALRLRKDVQKASYYVWFLGAEESRGLRGARILHSAIPYLVDRSREIEPIKVTLQVSHKGMKIIQGSSKHFISHSAITCSVQTDDIVACILLLYNPITKCPLHVHAYRCDSESTAQALNQQLQVLINRPENQKRFAELESRLGLLAGSPTGHNQIAPSSLSPTKPMKEKNTRSEDRQQSGPTSIKRFDSSLGSDTGTSTRESECSEEHTSVSPMSPISATKATLYDSLAAELRAKLNGNGPPLLLPPRDYDTVHRAKGNLAATELRRCRNSLIVGGPGSKYGVSSRGSSGIGSDLAPSPERQEAQSSSDEDWLEKKRRSEELMGLPARRPLAKSKYSALEKLAKDQMLQKQKLQQQQQQQQQLIERPVERSPDQRPPSYLYPLQKPAYVVPASNASSNSRLERSSYIKDEDRNYSPPKEQEIKPKIIRPLSLDFKQFVPSDEMEDEDQDYNDDEHRFRNDSLKYRAEQQLNEKNKLLTAEATKHLQRTRSAPMDADDSFIYPRNIENGKGKYREENEDDLNGNEEEFRRYRENLTDKQKYRESLIEKQRSAKLAYRERQLDDGFCVRESAPVEQKDRFIKNGVNSNKSKYESDDMSVERKGYRSKSKQTTNNGYDDIDYARNPYKEPESLPYRESIERMMRSPAIRYKSFEDSGYDYDEEPMIEKYRDMRVSQYPNEVDEPRMSTRQRYKEMKQRSQSRSPDTVMRVPPLERFQNAKEKFKAIERDHPFVVEQVVSDRPWNNNDKLRASRRMYEPRDIPNAPRHLPPRQDPMLDWSSEDEHFGRNCAEQMHSLHRPQPPQSNVRIVPREHYEKNAQARMSSSKSLGNLAKGYRHSYAEPRNPMPRNSGRVGLAAVNPY